MKITNDTEIRKLISLELRRQQDTLQMIPSENYASIEVLNACGSVLNNKYAEGYPKKRYYQGNAVVDEVEALAIERAKKLFKVPHANVQPYSGSPANMAVYSAVCRLGDVIMGQNLPDGGHLTHGWKVNFSGQLYKSVPYQVAADGKIDLEKVRKLALEHKPKLIWCGATAYAREIPFEGFSKIADEIGAYFAADISHIAGLVAGGAHKSPVPYAHIITTTTHKTLRGPRGAMIMVTEKGFQKDPELAVKIDRAVFPGLQGGPHMHSIAAKAIALHEALQPEFKEYAVQIVRNAQTLAKTLMEKGIKLVSEGTDNHLILIDLIGTKAVAKEGMGKSIATALEEAGIITNANAVPFDPAPPFKPSGIRLGTPALTARGMKEKEMEKIGRLIVQVINHPEDALLLQEIKIEVHELCSQFPIYEKMT